MQKTGGGARRGLISTATVIAAAWAAMLGVAGLPGICAAGTTTCPGGVETCSPGVGVGQESEICDGLDNDCDGQVDEGIGFTPASCTLQPVPNCPSSFSATGVKKCINGTEVCEALPNVHFCNHCGQTISAGDCGGCWGNTCTLDDDCPPNHVCNQQGECTYVSNCGPINGLCWMPSDNGACPFP